MVNIIKLLISVVTCLTAGFLSSFFMRDSLGTWYVYLKKPFFTPPSWVFAPAWTILYILMGVSAFLVWKHGFENKKIKTALYVFLAQLVLNMSWTFAFFGMQSTLSGLVVIVMLWIAIAVTIFLFYKIARVSGFLLLPYIAWVSFALLLNVSIFYLNLK